MGIYDRDYVQRSTPRANMPGGGLSVNTWLIIINVVIHLFAVTVLARPSSLTMGNWSLFHEWGHFSTAKAFFFVTPDSQILLNLQVWRLLSFQFLHDPNSIWHLALNMFGLFIFGRTVEQYLGSKKYLAFYLVCGIFGALLYLVLNLLGQIGISVPGVLVSDPRTPLVGASAGVFGVILACAFIAPNTVVQLIFPPIPLKMKYFAYGYVALATFNLLIGGNNAGGDAAHLGGAAAGFFFIRHSHLLTDFFDVFDNSKLPKKDRKSKGRAKSPNQAEIDRILVKVSEKGLASLTDREKKTLREASERAQQ